MSNETWDGPPSRSSSGPAQEATNRVGGALSTTVPTTSAMCVPSVRRCSHLESTRHSETLLWPQYSAVRSASVSACQICPLEPLLHLVQTEGGTRWARIDVAQVLELDAVKHCFRRDGGARMAARELYERCRVPQAGLVCIGVRDVRHLHDAHVLDLHE